MTDLASLQGFIEDYEIRPLPSDEPPTLMEIAGFPHWENVYSNILKFLIDTNEVHGFGSLFLRSILAAYGANCPNDVSPSVRSIERTDRVDREVTTKNRKRIDILIHCSDVVICIENKIGARVSNDLAEYRRHCAELRRSVIGIVLSPTPVSQDDESRLKENGFANVMYKDLVTEVRKRMGGYLGPHNTQYQYLLFDFLEQADRLKRSIMVSEEQMKFLEFWRRNERQIGNMLENCDALLESLREMGLPDQHLQQCLDRMEDKAVFSPFVWQKDTAAFDLADNGYLGGCRVFLDVWFQPLRIEHQLGKRGGPDLGTLVDRIKEEATRCYREWVRSGESSDVPSGVEATDITFTFNQSSGRYVVANDLSPFREADQKQAVAVSVAILQAIANMGREHGASSGQGD